MTTSTMKRSLSFSRRESIQLDSPVLLKPQTPPVTGRARRLLQKCQTVMKDSPLTVLGLSTKRSPKISEIVQQTKVLCEVTCPTSIFASFLIVVSFPAVIYYEIYNNCFLVLYNKICAEGYAACIPQRRNQFNFHCICESLDRRLSDTVHVVGDSFFAWI